ncbi:hypothetical protein [Tamilnaduibacter salinus]|nr:hypothetical protein [Tamilnaduibacter salinus]
MNKSDFTNLYMAYRNHPLGHALKIFSETSDIDTQHRMYISAKTMIHLLKYQGEFNSEQESAFLDYLEKNVLVRAGAMH